MKNIQEEQLERILAQMPKQRPSILFRIRILYRLATMALRSVMVTKTQEIFMSTQAKVAGITAGIVSIGLAVFTLLGPAITVSPALSTVLAKTNQAEILIGQLRTKAGIETKVASLELFSVAYADESLTAEITQSLVTQIDTNIDDAITAAQTIVVPAELSSALETIDDTQNQQITTFQDVSDVVTDDSITAVLDTALDTAVDQEAEVATALNIADSATSTVTVVIPINATPEPITTDISDKVETKLALAETALVGLKDKLVAMGITEEQATATVATLQSRYDRALVAFGEGKIGRAHGILTSLLAQSKANKGRLKKWASQVTPSTDGNEEESSPLLEGTPAPTVEETLVPTDEITPAPTAKETPVLELEGTLAPIIKGTPVIKKDAKEKKEHKTTKELKAKIEKAKITIEKAKDILKAKVEKKKESKHDSASKSDKKK